MIETVMHALGICGDVHPKLVDTIPFIHYLNNSAFAYTLKNTWQNLI
jgi:hypothetical protein